MIQNGLEVYSGQRSFCNVCTGVSDTVDTVEDLHEIPGHIHITGALLDSFHVVLPQLYREIQNFIFLPHYLFCTFTIFRLNGLQCRIVHASNSIKTASQILYSIL